MSKKKKRVRKVQEGFKLKQMVDLKPLWEMKRRMKKEKDAPKND